MTGLHAPREQHGSAMTPCTIHASGVFSLFSAAAFAQREHTIERVVFFDRKSTFKSRPDFLARCAPILRFFDIPDHALTYVTTNEQAASNYSDIYEHDASRVLFAESLQSPENQKLIELIAPRDLHFYAEGAMSYGPIRNGLPANIRAIMKGVHYVDYGNGLAPIAVRQFGVNDYGMSNEDFAALLEQFFFLLDREYRDTTQIDAFLGSVPSNSIVLVHQNLSAIAGFEPKTEGDIFKSIQKQIQTAWSGGFVVFMHPKGVRSVEDIFDVNPDEGMPVFVLPDFPFAEYYISRMNAVLTIGIFSTSLLNIHSMNLPVMTMETHFIGSKIKAAFDSNLYALHFVQLVLGSYEHERKMYPSLDIKRLQQHLLDNNFARCSVKTQKLWELPYLIGDTNVLRQNLAQAKADMNSLQAFTTMPAFRRLSQGRKEMLALHGLPAATIRKKALELRAMQIYNFIKKKFKAGWKSKK